MFIMNGIGSLFEFAGGIGMFLYGMNRMADGMQKSAGGKMKSLLGYLTRNRFLAILVGALITAIIQSSGATTVMVVGFVNAGLMTLVQAVGVIMGANIGTTITAWIVSLGQIGDAAKALQPSFYAPLLIGIGAFVSLFSKKDRSKTVGELFVGIGLLFEGLEFMSASIAPYTDAPIFSNAFKIVGSNPFLGILIGIIVTAILQSSSASVGILQTLAMNGVVTTNAAIFITLGQNIGSCVTALISSAGGDVESWTYLVHVILPTGTAELNVQALLNDNSDYDVVIGMDIINSCDFCYTNKDGKSTFSLCHPAKEKIILK